MAPRPARRAEGRVHPGAGAGRPAGPQHPAPRRRPGLLSVSDPTPRAPDPSPPTPPARLPPPPPAGGRALQVRVPLAAFASARPPRHRPGAPLSLRTSWWPRGQRGSGEDRTAVPAGQGGRPVRNVERARPASSAFVTPSYSAPPTAGLGDPNAQISNLRGQTEGRLSPGPRPAGLRPSLTGVCSSGTRGTGCSEQGCRTMQGPPAPQTKGRPTWACGPRPPAPRCQPEPWERVT